MLEPIWIRLRSVLDRSPDSTSVELSRESAEEMLAEITRLTAENAKLREALEAALENGAGVSYSCDEDECGNHVCCGEVSYKPHAPDCWTLKARAALSGDKQ